MPEDIVFGPIGTTSIAALLAVVIQVIKREYALEGKPALWVSLGMCAVVFLPYFMIWMWDTLPLAKLIYTSVFYTLAGWMYTSGMYSIVKTSLGK